MVFGRLLEFCCCCGKVEQISTNGQFEKPTKIERLWYGVIILVMKLWIVIAISASW
jgi:hypothetical protein